MRTPTLNCSLSNLILINIAFDLESLLIIIKSDALKEIEKLITIYLS